MTIEILFEGNKKIAARMADKVIHTDQPQKAGGDGTAPSPFDLFLSSVGTCAGFYIKSFCDQRNIPVDGIKVYQHLNYNPEKKLFDKIDIEIRLPENFPPEYKEALVRAAESCPVKKHLMNPPEINVFTDK